VTSGYTDTYSDIYAGGTPAITVAGSASFAVPATTAQPPPATLSLPVAVTNTAGNWMVAVIAWRDLTTGQAASPTFTVADDAHNWWEPLVPGSSTSSATGGTRCSIWVAPAAKAAKSVYVAPTGFSMAYAATIYDVGGMQPWVSTSAVTAVANAGTTITGTLAPGASAVIFTVSGSDNLSDTVSLTGSGWSPVTSVTASNGTDHTADINCASAWQVASSSVTATWNSTGALNFSEAVGAALVAANPLTPASPHWPVTILECAPGGGVQTPPDQLSWTPMTAQYMRFDFTQGRQYETAQLSTGEGTLLLDNPAGALIPPGTGAFSGITVGTPVRLRTAWQGGSWQVSFHGDGTTAGPQIDTGQIFAVSPGATYSVSAWLACSPAYASGVTLQLKWHTSGGTLISTVTSAAVTTQTAALATAAGVAPGTAALANVIIGAAGTPPAATTFYAAAAQGTPAVSGYLTIPAGVSWAAENGATRAALGSWQPDPNGPPDVTPWYLPFSGFIERLPQGWDDQYRGVTEASVTDAWFGANYVPQPILITEILNDQPYAYWPCTDQAGASVASNLAPGNSSTLNVTQSKYGAGGATETFGQNGSALLGAQSTTLITTGFRITHEGGMWGQALAGGTPTGTQLDQGYALTCTDTSFPAVSAGVTIEGWWQVDVINNNTNNSALLWAVNYAQTVPSLATPGFLYLQANGSGGGPAASLELDYVDAAGTFHGANIVASSLATGVHHVAVAFTQAAYTVYVNGVSSASGSFAGGGLKSGRFTTLVVSGANVLNTTVTIPGFGGSTGHIAVHSRLLPQPRILTHYQAGITALAGEPAHYRIERILDAGNATGRRLIMAETGNSVTAVTSCQDIPGQPASASVNNIVGDLLPGIFAITPNGDMFLLARQQAWDQPVPWTLGDSVAAGEIPYENGIAFDYDPSRVQNQIQLTQLDNQDTIGPSDIAAENASQAQIGTISNLATGYLEGDALSALTAGPGLYDLANWLATTYGQPALRLTQVTVNAASQPAAWPFVLGASATDMATVNRRQFGGSPLISVTGRITQVQRSFQFSEAGFTGTLQCIVDSAPEENALTADDPARGQLTGSNVLAW